MVRKMKAREWFERNWPVARGTNLEANILAAYVRAEIDGQEIDTESPEPRAFSVEPLLRSLLLVIHEDDARPEIQEKCKAVANGTASAEVLEELCMGASRVIAAMRSQYKSDRTNMEKAGLRLEAMENERSAAAVALEKAMAILVRKP